jgi:hypothetical protein
LGPKTVEPERPQHMPIPRMGAGFATKPKPEEGLGLGLKRDLGLSLYLQAQVLLPICHPTKMGLQVNLFSCDHYTQDLLQQNELNKSRPHRMRPNTPKKTSNVVSATWTTSTDFTDGLKHEIGGHDIEPTPKPNLGPKTVEPERPQTTPIPRMCAGFATKTQTRRGFGSRFKKTLGPKLTLIGPSSSPYMPPNKDGLKVNLKLMQPNNSNPSKSIQKALYISVYSSWG